MPGFYQQFANEIAALQTDVAAIEADIVVIDAELIRLDELADPPTLSLIQSAAGPTFSIGAGVAVDVPIFAIDFDDRTGCTILGGGAYFQVADIFNHPGDTVQFFAWADIRAAVGGTGNVTWLCDLITGFNLGTGSEVIIEDTEYRSDTTSNDPGFQGGAPEGIRIPGIATPVELGARISHNASTRNWTCTGVTAGIRQQKVF